MDIGVFVACDLPQPAREPFSDLFSARFNSQGRTLLPAELIVGAQDADVIVVTATDRVDASTIAALPDAVRIIATYSVGLEHVDLSAAGNRGIAVLSTPDVLSESCADTAILLMLGAARRVVEGLDLVRSGSWTGWTPKQLLGRDLHGSRLGILGMGRIGRAVARRARGFGMAVHYHNRRPLAAELSEGAEFHYTLTAMLDVSDVLCVACPSSAETRHLIDTAAIQHLPDGAIVTNISRGDVIDDRALIAALRNGRVAAAGLDVFENEPRIDPAYRALPNVFALPHIGSATLQTRVAMARLLAVSVHAALSGKSVNNRVV